VRPVAERRGRNPKRRFLREAHARATRRGMLPRKEGQDRAGVADLVAIIEMVGARIVEVDRLLDEAEPEGARIEIQVTPGVAGNRGHVMNAGHDLRLSPALFATDIVCALAEDNGRLRGASRASMDLALPMPRRCSEP
jgi:hypothetical protein